MGVVDTSKPTHDVARSPSRVPEERLYPHRLSTDKKNPSSSLKPLTLPGFSLVIVVDQDVRSQRARGSASAICQSTLADLAA